MSPYLFTIVITVLCRDLHRDDDLNLVRYRQDKCKFDEVLYADDTILVSSDTMAINRQMQELEIVAQLYGLRLNKYKLNSCSPKMMVYNRSR